ncbi:MAG TPA: FtsK/SpoIIIE domain-containing protein, partial [Bacilli bacterium]|nr:FtsK/SpoIIIE domain-containing protein [Bacilli bacterium]
PHLAGTITNLDLNEINRSLSSLQSELKRRQKAFNKARDILLESTIDIYKYQKLYREGKVKEPISHLFIISDEFAELKVQQPDFMGQLISTARIGRGLGVHLILATQKPSGVVDDQIWSNSKFRVCLKVQDKADSVDMIRSPEAALLKDPGRFYLQVGYNEYFALGQSAWCGAPYYETDKRKKKIDTAINFVDNIGFVVKSIENENNKINLGVHKGEELPNVLKYLIDTAEKENVHVKKLWLDRIPDEIYINKLKDKYHYQKSAYSLNPLVGEYDVPTEQRQGLLTLPISAEGNAFIYGAVGSGKEDFLSALIYSLIVNYDTDEVNIYLMDFGSEALKMYRSAPQMGDIVLANDGEKVVNLLKLLKKNLDERKRLFSDYGGNYNTYIKSNQPKLPNIVVIINHIQVFIELYNKYEEVLIQLIRDSQKYGIYFIATTINPTSVRFKVTQNFKQKICLQLNDNGDYSSVVGRTKLIPYKNIGRGLIKLDDIYEFQTALPYKRDYLNDYIKAICAGLKKHQQKTAPRIPVLPNIVSCEYVRPSLLGIESIPVGVEKETLEIRTVDLKHKLAMLITAQEFKTIETFTKVFTQQLTELDKIRLFIFDAERLFLKPIKKAAYFNAGFNDIIKKMADYVDELYTKYQTSGYDETALDKFEHTICVVLGIDKFQNLLTPENQKLYAGAIDKAKNLNKLSFIFVDSIDNFRKSEYDNWYKSMINSSRGIWIGNGITDQMTLKIIKATPEMREEIPAGYAYDILNGNPCLVKYIESYEQDDDYEIL